MKEKMEEDLTMWCSVCGRWEIAHIELPKKKCKGCGTTDEWKAKDILN